MRIDDLAGLTGSSVATPKDRGRLEDAAQQFEAMLLQEMLKPLRPSENKWDEGDVEVDKSSDTLSGYGTEALAKAVSKAGGVGIAKRVMEQVGLESTNRSGRAGTKV